MVKYYQVYKFIEKVRILKKKIQKQFLLYYLLFSVCPLLLLSVFSYYNVKVNSENQLISSMMYDLKQSQASLDEIYTRVIKYTDIVSNSKEFYEVMDYMSSEVETGNYDAAQYAGVSHLDSLLKSLFATDSSLAQVLVFIQGRCVYSYNSYFSIMTDQHNDPILQIANTSSITYWIGNYQDPFGYFKGNYTIALKDIKSIFTGTPNQSACQFVILLNQSTVNSLLNNSTHYPGSMVAVFDTKDQLLAISDQSAKNVETAYKTISSLQVESLKEKGNVQSQRYGNNMLISSVSKLSGWKMLQLVPKRYVENASRFIVIVTLLLIAGLILLMSGFSFLMSRKFLMPIRRLANAMKEVGDKNFSIAVPNSMDNEIGQIYSGFNEMVANLDQLFKKTVEKENQKRLYHINMLKYQINPHFLYNTLSSVRYLAISQKDDRTAEMLLVLSRLFRNTLGNSNDQIPLYIEINNIKDYLYLQQVRYDNRLTVIYQIEDSADSLLVPSMILQPLAENSITHGLNGKLNSCCYSEIKISASIIEDRLVICIRDNGIGILEDKLCTILQSEAETEVVTSHIGIINIHRRIRLQYGEPYGITLKSEAGKYTCAQILLPVIRNEQEDLL